jgi:hypothetical protein
MGRQTRRTAIALFFAIALIGGRLEGQAPAQIGEPTVTNLGISPNQAAAGDTVTLKAKVARANPGPDAPSGTVEFFDLDVSLGTANLSSSNSEQVASLAVTTLSAGPHQITARYSGDNRCAGSQSQVVTYAVMGQ